MNRLKWESKSKKKTCDTLVYYPEMLPEPKVDFDSESTGPTLVVIGCILMKLVNEFSERQTKVYIYLSLYDCTELNAQ